MRVLVADDHPLYREAAATQLRRLYRKAQIDEVSSVAELRERTSQAVGAYDLILIDYRMPGMSPEALALLVADFPAIPLAVMSGSASSADVRAAVQAGVKAYIPKTATPDYFAHALKMLLAGGSSIPADILLDRHVPAGEGEAWLSKMSEREREVLSGVARGQSNKEIGRALGLAEVTIKLHLRNLFRKMEVKNRAEAAVKAVKAGLG